MSKTSSMHDNAIVYAHKSANCRKLLALMQDCGIINLFKHVDISIPGVPVPRGITDIPTIITSSVPKPLVGNEAFKWVNDIRRIKEQNNRVSRAVAENKYEWNMIKSKVTDKKEEQDKLLPYDENVMSSFSDPFCLVNDGVLPQNHVGISESVSMFMVADNKQKISGEVQKSLIEKEKKRREEQDSFYTQNIERTMEKIASGDIKKTNWEDSEPQIMTQQPVMQQPVMQQPVQPARHLQLDPRAFPVIPPAYPMPQTRSVQPPAPMRYPTLVQQPRTWQY